MTKNNKKAALAAMMCMAMAVPFGANAENETRVITAGTLNANVIRAGIITDALGYNSWNLDTGALSITNGTINITTNSANYDIISLLYNDGGANNVSASMQSGGFSVTDHNNALTRWYEMNRWGYCEYQDNADRSMSYTISVLANATLRLGGTAGAAADGVNVGGNISINDSEGEI